MSRRMVNFDILQATSQLKKLHMLNYGLALRKGLKILYKYLAYLMLYFSMSIQRPDLAARRYDEQPTIQN